MPKIPPGPKGRFLLGELKEIRKDILAYLKMNVREYPGISRVKVSHYYYINLSDPAYIEHVFLHHNIYIKGRDNRNLAFLLGKGLLTNSGEFWLNQRRLIQPLFHRQRLQGFFDSMASITFKKAQTWEANTRQLDMHNEMMQLTLQIVSATLMSSDVSGDFRKVSEAVGVIMEGMFNRTRTVLRLPYWLPLPGNIKMTRHRKMLDETIYRIIENRRKSHETFNDLLTMLMEVEDADTAERMTDQQLRDELITIFLAGHETTANALTFAFYFLAKYPEVKAKIVAEVERVVGDEKITFSHVAQLQYTKQVIEETMRLYPPAWGIVREVGADDVIDDWQIKKGDNIVVAPYIVHRIEKYWDDPETFDPGRFHPEKIKERPKYSYFPFGGGQRLCIGNNFAMMEMQIILATLCPRFDFALPDDFKLELDPLVTLRPKCGMPIKIKALARSVAP